MARALPRTPTAEDRARTALQMGTGLLVLGLGLVGVGQGMAGTIPVLVGLVTTIGAIHVFGRLGPDGEIERPDESPDETGGAAEGAGEAGDGDPPPVRPRRTKARVEKRRRMDKSPAP